MEAIQAAADDKQLSDIMVHFHASFLGNRNMRKQQLQAYFYYHFRGNPTVRVYLSNTEISVEGEEAEVSCHILVTGSQKNLPDRGRLYQIQSSWKKIEGRWQVIDADWEDALNE